MKRVILVRHAKASPAETGMKDHERPLNEKGEQACELVGDYMENKKLIPDFVFCSTARRTRQTLELLEKKWSSSPLKTFKPLLYGGGVNPYFDVIYTASAADDSIMIVGHNPDIQLTGLDLLKEASPEIYAKIEKKYATAGVLVMDFEVDVWSEIKYKSPVSASFMTPKMLRHSDETE